MKQKSFHIPFSSKTTYEKFKKAAKVKGLILPTAINEAMELWIETNKRKKSKANEQEELKKLEKIKKEVFDAVQEWEKIDNIKWPKEREAREKQGAEDEKVIEHFNR